MKKLETIQKEARSYIKRLETLGWEVPETVKIRANAEIPKSKKMQKIYRDLLLKSHIDMVTKPKYVKIKKPRMVYLRNEFGRPLKELDKVPKYVEKTVELRPGDAEKMYIKQIKNMMENYPSRERAESVFKDIADIYRAAGKIPFEGKSPSKVTKNILENIPSSKELENLVLETREKHDIAAPTTYFALKTKEYIKNVGTDKESHEAANEFAYERGLEQFKISRTAVQRKHVLQLVRFFETASNWQKFRRQIKSDDFLEDLSDMLEEFEERTPEGLYREPDWEYLDKQMSVEEDTKEALNKFAEHEGLEWRL